MGAAAHEVQVPIAAVPILGSQVAYLPEIMAEAERGSFGQVVLVFPVVGTVTDLKFQVFL